MLYSFSLRHFLALVAILGIAVAAFSRPDIYVAEYALAVAVLGYVAAQSVLSLSGNRSSRKIAIGSAAFAWTFIFVNSVAQTTHLHVLSDALMRYLHPDNRHAHDYSGHVFWVTTLGFSVAGRLFSTFCVSEDKEN